MSAQAYFAGLRERFSTLGEYLGHLEGLRAGDRRVLCKDVSRWGLGRLGVISMARVDLSRPMFVASGERMGYDAAVDVRSGTVDVACDLNGLAARSREVVWRSSVEDNGTIRRINGIWSDPFVKAEFVLGNEREADRIIGEMMMLEKREFFWCFVHGLVHAMDIGIDHTVFATCSHGVLIGVGERFQLWPSIRCDTVDIVGVK